MATISFENVSGIHERAISLRIQRNHILANNISNASTPGFKARDIDFRSAMASAMESSENLDGFIEGSDQPELMYRIPTQPSLDNNTVDPHVEMANFSRNNMEFMATIRFLDGSLSSMERAFRGE